MAWHYTRWRTRPPPSSAHRRPRPRCPRHGLPLDQPCCRRSSCQRDATGAKEPEQLDRRNARRSRSDF
eukprot:scaffold13345_cov64-Phaeocystis_antarctica.AAC.2